MPYKIRFSTEAEQDVLALRAAERTAVLDAVDLHLKHRPDDLSRSRIKRLRGTETPQYRLRVGPVRVFYDLVGDEVRILAVHEKRAAMRWLAEHGG